ncbi:MAG: PfkB family carbohydrate kinase, partial [Deltaproteobacteria bacterium]|nr:PfkB family carbohydrate kinase [Deltaproteobacteria bacterium]
MTIICSGSLAFDRLSEFPGRFQDHILTGKLDCLNVCFLVDRVERVHGGTAGNIGYNLCLLREKPLLVSVVGDDPDGRDYLDRLRSWELDLSQVETADLPTSGAYIATDRTSNQLSFFHPGAMVRETGFDPRSLPEPPEKLLAIVSPGGMADMKRLCRIYHETGIRFIFDPGQ